MFSRVEQGLPLTAVEACLFCPSELRAGAVADLHPRWWGCVTSTHSPTERYEHRFISTITSMPRQQVRTVSRKVWRMSIAALCAGGRRSDACCLARENHSDAGAILIDLQQMRTDGKILGYQEVILPR